VTISKKYQNYLNSQKWKNKRLKVLNREKFRCERCKEARATQVHHKTYKRIHKERLSDLMAVCAPCHRAIHGIKTTRRRKTKKKAIEFLTRVFFG